MVNKCELISSSLLVFLGYLGHLELLRRIIRLDRLSDDGAGGVTMLEVLALRCNRPRHVTTRDTYSN